jgi:predicted SnoaL-like aldol condensation-catalyzing enzyme
MNTYKAGCFIGVSIVTMNQALAGCLQKKPQAAGARFFELAFDQHKPTEAAEKVLGNHYIQHNPNHANGAEAFAVDFEKYLKEHPNYHVRFAQVFADGDIVILHSEHQAEENNLGRAIIDLQAVPEAR